MSKFIFTACLLVLLASFLDYPISQDDANTEKKHSAIIFPISEQIKLARMEKQITQKELATRTGLSKMNIERIEKGHLVPTREVLDKLEKELNTPLNLNGY
jgi:ribosome-binding protein aMBF1 (putative translation factor)